jgi:hypothetical protein
MLSAGGLQIIDMYKTMILTIKQVKTTVSGTHPQMMRGIFV